MKPKYETMIMQDPRSSEWLILAVLYVADKPVRFLRSSRITQAMARWLQQRGYCAAVKGAKLKARAVAFLEAETEIERAVRTMVKM